MSMENAGMLSSPLATHEAPPATWEESRRFPIALPPPLSECTTSRTPFPACPVPERQDHPAAPVKRVLPDTGMPSLKYRHLGVWCVSLGPGSEIPGDHFLGVVIDTTGKVVRSMEAVPRSEISDDDDGPDVLVDYDENGEADEILAEDFPALCADRARYFAVINRWCQKHGRRQYAL